MRHGESDHNTESFYSTNPTHPQFRESYLTKRGEREVVDTAMALQKLGIVITAVYSSPLERTQATARIIMEKLNIPSDSLYLDVRLIERQAGNHEGMPMMDRLDASYETIKSIQQRLTSFYSELPRGENILVVTHGTPARLLTEIVTGKRTTNPRTGSFVVLPLTEKYASDLNSPQSADNNRADSFHGRSLLFPLSFVIVGASLLWLLYMNKHAITNKVQQK